MLDVKVEGADELIRKLKQLDKNVAKKVMRQALRNACKTIQKEAKGNAPVASGQTKRAIKVRAGRKARNKIRYLVQLGAGNYKGDSFYGAFQEFGYKRGSRKLGDNRKQIEGKHFMQKAAETKGQEAADKAAKEMKEAIERELSK